MKKNLITRIVALAAFGLLAAGASLTAATITVTNTNDNGAGSLRQALVDAAAGDTIDFSVTGTIALATELAVTKAVTIQGPAAPGIIIDGGSSVRVFNVTATGSDVAFSALTITNGVADNGGGIMNAGAILTVSNSFITNNGATAAGIGMGGGGIFNDGTLNLANSEVTGNGAGSALANGGGILNSPNGTLFVSASIIDMNSTARAGGGIENNGGTVQLVGVTLGGTNGNVALINGGGLHTSAAGTVTVSGGVVQNNGAAQEGGGLWNSLDGTLTVSGGTRFVSNQALGDDVEQGGGGVFNDGGTVTISGATFNSNDATAASVGNGGGGLFNKGALTVSDTFLFNNSASGTLGNGGGILNSTTGVLIANNCLFQQNVVNRAGGGIENNGGSVVLNDSQFFNNSAAINGGGLHTGGAGSATVAGGFFSTNVATQEGGGLWNSSTGTLTVAPSAAGSATIISNNVAFGDGLEQGGGGIFNDGGTVTVTGASLTANSSVAAAIGNGGGGIFNDGTLALVDTEVRGNTASGGTGNGGGILNSDGGILTVTRGQIAGNRTARAGGGIENNGGTADLIDTTLGGSVAADSNFAGINGGGLHSGAGTVTVTRSLVSANRADNEGGGLWNSGLGIFSVNNSTVDGNSAVNGGGIYVDGAGTITVANSTISGNDASGNGGGIVAETGVATIGNSIVALNTSAGASADVSGTFATQGYNLIGVGDGATGFTDGQTNDQVGSAGTPLDPLLGPLQDNGGLTFTRALLTGSPAIDQGKRDTVATLVALTDQRGMGRPFDILNIANAEGGDGSDIGAFELATATFANLSTRLQVGTGENVLISGVIVVGPDPQMTLIRGLGPSLDSQGLSANLLADPVLQLYDGAGTLIATNDNWMDTNKAAIQATNLAPPNNAEAAILRNLAPGNYTTILKGKSMTTGIGLLELYGLEPNSGGQFANISSRGFVDLGDNVLIAGLILSGNDTTSVLFRAIGPSLVNSGIAQPLANPMIEIFDAQGNSLAANDDWKDTQQAAISATGAAPKNNKESAVLIDLGAGTYTAIVTGVNQTTGIALVEAYRLQ